ncbi:hypothetical protein SUGI_0342880 [Cryptomeria japonica]|nr:hypothetical protein SUGI_0342880 [Cryptomeria japonica]
MARRKQSSLLRLNPCFRRQVMKTDSYETIEKILKGKLETIVEEPSPRSQAASSSLLVKTMVSMKVQKNVQNVWCMGMSKFNTVVVAPFSNLGSSYVRLMNGFAYKSQVSGLHIDGSAKPICII